MVNGLRSRWAGLPRDARDTFFMLGLIAWTVAPHLARLPVGVSLLCAGVLAWRAVLAWRDAALPGRWPLLAVLLLAAGLTWWDQHTLLGREAGITLLVVLMSGVHGMLSRHVKDFAADKRRKNAKFFRIINEVPTVLMIAEDIRRLFAGKPARASRAAASTLRRQR